MGIASSQLKNLISTFFFDTCYRTKLWGNVCTAGRRNHACCMAVQIASKRQRRNQSCFGSVYFFVCLSNSFEQVPVPGTGMSTADGCESLIYFTGLFSNHHRTFNFWFASLYFVDIILFSTISRYILM